MIKHILTLAWNKKRSNTLMLLEIFFAFLILFAVFAFAVYYLRIYQEQLGFATEDSMILRLSIPEETDSLARLEMRQQLVRELEAMPEVKAASMISNITPFSGSMWSYSSDDNGFYLESVIFPADENFAHAADLQLVEGRWYTEADLDGRYPPVVINKQLQAEFFNGESLLDSIISIDMERKVVGVVDHFKYRDEFEEELPISFLLMEPHDVQLGSMYLRLQAGAPAEAEEKIYNTLARILKQRDFVIESTESLRRNRARTTWIPLVSGLSICGFLILNIALGLFGVLYYNISKRKSEIGLRRAIGATQNEISRQFTFEIFLVATLGMLLAGLLAIQFPLLQLIDIPATNFYYAIGLTTLLISLVVLLCAFLPSRQAARIHPATALHEE